MSTLDVSPQHRQRLFDAGAAFIAGGLWFNRRRAAS
jgi:hypothetical protein